MRIDEIASAEDQIALFKLITDKVWQALGDQQRAEAETKAAQPLKAKLKPMSPKSIKQPAAWPAPKLATRAATPATLKAQPARTQPFIQQSQATPAQNIKQKQISNRDKEPQSADFDELSNQ